MSLITNQNAEIPHTDNTGQVGNVKPVDKIDPLQSNQFSDLVDKNGDQVEMAQDASEGQITPEELQRQIRENLFKNGFNKAIEKAKEISKELKEG